MHQYPVLIAIVMYNGDDFDLVFKIRSETCLTEAQFCQNLYLIKKESLPNRPKFCRSGSSVQHLFWRLQQIQTCQCRTSCNFAKTVPCVYWLRHIIIWAMEQSMLCTAAACSEANAGKFIWKQPEVPLFAQAHYAIYMWAAVSWLHMPEMHIFICSSKNYQYFQSLKSWANSQLLSKRPSNNMPSWCMMK